RLLKELVNEALGLGPLEDLLEDSSITEIMVNGPSETYIERSGRVEKTSVTFDSREQLVAVIERILSPLGRRIDERSPMVDARLKDGSRVNVVIEPLTPEGPVLTIRKFPSVRLGMQDLVRFRSLSEQMARFLELAVRARI